MTLDSKARLQILKSIKKLVLTKHINIAGVDCEAWATRLDGRNDVLLATDIEGFESGVSQMLAELKTSHTVFYHSLPKEFPPQHTINATLRELRQGSRLVWMFLDVFEDGPAHIAGIKSGDILEALDGKPCSPPILPCFAIGNFHNLQVTKIGSSSQSTITIEVPMRKGTKHRPPLVEPTSPIHRMVGQGIGLLKIAYFPGAAGIRFATQLDKAIHELKQQGCNRLIIDLRGNIGGSLGFARLASYMCPGKIAIGNSLTPNRLRKGFDIESLPRVPMPASKAELLITLGRFLLRDKSVMLLTQGLGEQPFHNRIAILVNEWTNSAAEIVTSFATGNRLATIVGVKTRGNVLGATNFKVGGGYWLRLPVFGWFSSKGVGIEGIGVEPDVSVEISADALALGEDNQMIGAMKVLNGLG